MIVILLVYTWLLSFYASVEAQVLSYVSLSPLLGIDLTIAQSGLEVYPSLSVQVAAGTVVDHITDANRF